MSQALPPSRRQHHPSGSMMQDILLVVLLSLALAFLLFVTLSPPGT